jgi:phospholipase C
MTALTRPVAMGVVGLVAGLAIVSPAHAGSPADPSGRTSTPLKHFIFLMQGDRTFDNYFGTYPAADGIPAGTCQPLVLGRSQSDCVKPFPLHGKPPAALAPSTALVDGQIDGGKMDGFVAAYARQGRDGAAAMGHYDARDLPFYWSVADRYVLFDKFFSSVPYGSRANRSYWVSAAAQPGDTDHVPPDGYPDQPTIFDRLQAAGVSWKFYVQDYQPAETYRAASGSDPASQTVRVPLLNYPRFVDDPALRSHIVDLEEYYQDLAHGTLPAVAYVASSGASERSARTMQAGQDLVRTMLTQLAMSSAWSSSALMWSYDGSGGWYDHVAPPAAADGPRGLRVPAVLVSPYAPAGRVDHQVLDSSSALRFIEDNWNLRSLGGRDASATGLASAFDFSAAPRSPEVLAVPTARPAVRPVNATPVYGIYGGALGAAALIVAGTAVLAARRRSAATTAATGPAEPAATPEEPSRTPEGSTP